MADTYYVVNYAGKEYKTDDASPVYQAIKNGEEYTSIMAGGFGDGTPVEVFMAMAGIPVSIERRTRKGSNQAVIL